MNVAPQTEGRTRGLLPVRDHLRPKPLQRRFVWFFDRDDDGDLTVGAISLADAVGLEVAGEA